ncbi:MAG: 6-phosphogluconolactonase [Elusimicrobiota bacterium]
MAEHELIVVEDPAALSLAAAGLFADQARAAASARDAFHVALSGGNTPRGIYSLLATRRYADLPWARTHVYWGDERCVPREHPDSNYRMARELLLSKVPVPEAQVHPMPVSADGSADYERTLRAALTRLDLVLLGLGTDGHTASLFPGNPAVSETRHWVAAARAPSRPEGRLTLTLPALNDARMLLVVVAGEEKAEAFRRTLDGGTPASLLKPTDGRLVFLADESVVDQAREGDDTP